jgi:hypothetical protein
MIVTLATSIRDEAAGVGSFDDDDEEKSPCAKSRGFRRDTRGLDLIGRL